MLRELLRLSNRIVLLAVETEVGNLSRADTEQKLKALFFDFLYPRDDVQEPQSVAPNPATPVEDDGIPF